MNNTQHPTPPIDRKTRVIDSSKLLG